MALNWLKNILQREPPREKSEALRISELDLWLEERSRHPQLEKTVMQIYLRLAGLSRDLSRDLEKARAAKPPDGISPRLLKAGHAARGSMAKQIEPLLEKMEPPKDPGFDRAMEYHSALVSHLERTALKLGRAKRYAAAVFPQEFEQINSDMMEISQALAELGQSLEKRHVERKGLVRSKELLAQLKEDRARRASLMKELLDEEANLSRLRELEAGLRERGKLFASSDEGRKMVSLQAELDAMAERRGRIEAEMAALVAPLNKAISRLVKQDSSDRLDLKNRASLQKLSAVPWEAMDGEISGPLMELRSNVSLLGLKDRMEAKVIAHIDHLLEARPLEGLKSRHSAMAAELESHTSSLRETGLISEELEQENADLMLKIGRSNEVIAGLRTALAAVEDRATREEEELKGWVEEIGGGSLEIDLE